MPQLDRDGVAILYEISGTDAGRPPLLLTHGYAATSEMWQLNVAALARDRRVITWDLRGHGRSSSPEDPARYTVDATLADMTAVLDACNAPTAVLGGHSLGGYLSLLFALGHPERVAGLVLVATGPGFRDDAARAKWNALADRIATSVKDTGLANTARGVLPQHDARVIDGLAQIAAPTLVVVGANDHRYVGAAGYMAAKIPGAEHVVLPDAGHDANVDQPAWFDDAVTSFLRRVG